LSFYDKALSCNGQRHSCRIPKILVEYSTTPRLEHATSYKYTEIANNIDILQISNNIVAENNINHTKNFVELL